MLLRLAMVDRRVILKGGVAHQVGFFPQSSARIAYLLALKLDALRCG